MPEEMVTIKTFNNETEAEIAKGYLYNSGIKAFVSKDDCGGMYPQLQAAGVILKVSLIDATRAKRVLRQIKQPPLKSAADEFSKNLTAILSVLAWILIPAGSVLLIGFPGVKTIFYVGVVLAVIGIVLGIYLECKKRDIYIKSG